MFLASVEPFDFKAPWDIALSDRVDMLTRGAPRAAYYYDTPDTSTFRYRAFNVARVLADAAPGSPAAAWFTRRDLDSMDRVLDLCDVLVLCRTRYTHRAARLIQHARTRGRRVLFDVDDLVFDPSYVHLLVDTLARDVTNDGVWDDWFASVGRTAAVFQLCDGAIVTNPYLAARAREAFRDSRPVQIIPNFLESGQQAYSQSIWDAKEASGWARDGRIHLGYFSGTPTHDRDFAIVASTVAKLMAQDSRLVLRIVGFLDVGPELARHSDRIEFFPLQDYMNFQRVAGEVEISLVPLQDNVFTNCKSELKWFEAAPVGTLTVATPTYTYRNAIADRQTGWLAASQDWFSSLSEILDDIDGHEAVLRQGRDAALARHGFEHQLKSITEALFET